MAAGRSAAVLATVELAAFEVATVDASAELAARPPGGQRNRHNVPRRPTRNLVHTLDPWTWPSSSWATSVWVLPDPVRVGPDALRVRYCRRVRAGPTDSPARSSGPARP